MKWTEEQVEVFWDNYVDMCKINDINFLAGFMRKNPLIYVLSWSVKNNEFLCGNIVIISNNKVGVIHPWIDINTIWLFMSPHFPHEEREPPPDTFFFVFFVFLGNTRKLTFHSDKTNQINVNKKIIMKFKNIKYIST